MYWGQPEPLSGQTNPREERPATQPGRSTLQQATHAIWSRPRILLIPPRAWPRSPPSRSIAPVLQLSLQRAASKAVAGSVGRSMPMLALVATSRARPDFSHKTSREMNAELRTSSRMPLLVPAAELKQVCRAGGPVDCRIDEGAGLENGEEHVFAAFERRTCFAVATAFSLDGSRRSPLVWSALDT